MIKKALFLILFASAFITACEKEVTTPGVLTKPNLPATSFDYINIALPAGVFPAQNSPARSTVSLYSKFIA